MTNNKRSKFTFPVGYHKFHKKQVFNFQLNRWHSLGYARFEDMKEVGYKVKSFRDWKTEMVKLDVLILTGRNDHFIPIQAHEMQVKALTNAKSVTAKIFTKETHAHNHCQIGNIGLALDVMVKWIEKKS